MPLMWCAIGACVLPLRAIQAMRVTGADECLTRIPVADRTTLWAAPLDRVVSIRHPDAPLREVLDALARMAKVELSYSRELLPPDRRVCLSLERVPVGAVLETLLVGTDLRAIVLGASQVVLAPSRPVMTLTPTVSTDPAMSVRRTSVLDRVVVTGTPDGAPQRGSPFALEVIEGERLTQHRVRSLGEALELAVPGLWTWSATAGTVSARYGSIRGASSFGVSAPKIYVDGIEVANPVLATQLDASRIDRVEVIRGPQGAALYGADAISGVVNILTRHDGTPNGGRVVQVSTTAGLSTTAFAPRAAFVQDHALSLRAGSSSRSVGMGLSVGTVGAYVPGASEQRMLADADVRLARAQSILTGTARLSLQRANASTSLITGASFGNPRVLMPAGEDTATVPMLRGDSATGQDLVQYTVGATAAVMPNLTWTHTVIAGIDGYRLRGLSAVALPMPVASGSLFGDGQGAADRGTLRLRSVGRFDVREATLLSVTLAAEQAVMRDVGEVAGTGGRALAGPFAPSAFNRPASREIASWISNSGASVQANLSTRDAWFFVAGVRAERTVGATINAQHALLPMLGASYVHDWRGALFKARGAYGTGIRPARTPARGSTWMGPAAYPSLRGLDPERQSGTEWGADLHVGNGLSWHITRFDQRASELVQPVASVTTVIGANGRMQRVMSYALQNVGAITNRGWELQSVARCSSLSLAGALSLVSSRVDRVASGYRGDLRVGDRMLEVPARTLSVTAAYDVSRWMLSSTLSHAADWVGYDRAAVGAALSDTTRARDVDGAALRDYWTAFGGVTRWRATVSYAIRPELSLMLGGDNLLNVQQGAPDNNTVTVGRTLTFGVRTTF